MKKTSTRMADGRELIYYDSRDDTVRCAVDARGIARAATSSQVRHDPVLDEWVVIASHRQDRTHNPPARRCPLCPSRGGHQGEVAATDYEVVVFENRFPSLTGPPGDVSSASADIAALRAAPAAAAASAAGRCEVVCFSADHDASFADLTPDQAALVLEAWTDRTAELSSMSDVRQVFVFEDRGEEFGMSLSHPHGQIYAYPFVPSRTRRALDSAAAHRRRTGGNLFDDILAAERAAGDRVVISGAHWTAFVPHAPRWPYEVHLYPNRRVPDLTRLDDDARAEFPHIYLDLLARFDRLFAPAVPTVPYLSSWLQAPTDGGDEYALHLEICTIRRTESKIKRLAGSELLMDVYINEISPEVAADRLRTSV